MYTLPKNIYLPTDKSADGTANMYCLGNKIIEMFLYIFINIYVYSFNPKWHAT